MLRKSVVLQLDTLYLNLRRNMDRQLLSTDVLFIVVLVEINVRVGLSLDQSSDKPLNLQS